MSRELERAVIGLVAKLLNGRVEKDTPEWLKRPGRSECGKRWEQICTIYRALESRQLPEVMPSRERAHIDGILVTPDGIRRIIEIDEYQHFNLFRATTLELYPKNDVIAFPRKEWMRQCTAARNLPGAGFAKPCPPLFPAEGGRHRQRAFRDALRDLLPPLYDFAPTLRIAHFEVEDWIFGPQARKRMSALLEGRGLLPRTKARRTSGDAGRMLRRAATTLIRSTAKRSRPEPAKRPRTGPQRQTADTPHLHVLRAAAFAAGKHRNQRRKDAEASPYINHPIALAELLASAGVEKEEVLVAGLLHDTVEDTATSFEELERHFGKGLADIVREVTDDKSLPKEERKRLQVEHAADLSREAKLVKLADKICNLRDIGSAPPAGWPLERKQEYFDWAKRVVDRMRGTHPELEQLFDAEYARRPEA
jgi:guanosine-3',5'-bis(diphosphate) 3'-pyrophosphohydrolase